MKTGLEFMKFIPRTGEQFFDLVEISQPEIIVEVGTWYGASIIGFLQAAKSIGLTPTAIAVDTWLGSVEHWTDREKGEWARSQLKLDNGEPNFITDFRSNVKSYGFESQVQIVRAPSQAGLAYLLQQKIFPSLIYIDGDHSYSAVKSDIALSMQFGNGKNSPLLAGDDWPWASVRRAVILSAVRYGQSVWVKNHMWIIGKRANLTSALISRGWTSVSELQFVALMLDLAAIRDLVKKLKRRIIRGRVDPVYSQLREFNSKWTKS